MVYLKSSLVKILDVIGRLYGSQLSHQVLGSFLMKGMKVSWNINQMMLSGGIAVKVSSECAKG